MANLEFGYFLDMPTDQYRVDELMDRHIPLLQLAEKNGFTSVWAGESFGNAPGGSFQHAPSSLLVIASLVGHTSMRLGTAVSLAPAWSAVNLAYAGALLDQLSSGRFSLGLGVANPGIWKKFSTQKEELADQIDDLIGALKALWTGAEEFEGRSTHVRVPGGIGPLPVQPGGPPIWVGGKIAPSARRAAILGDGLLAGTHFRFTMVEGLIAEYRRTLAAIGKKPEDGPISLNRFVVLAEDEDEAWETATKSVGVLMRKYAKFHILDQADEFLAADDDDVAALQKISADICLIGTPESIMPDLERYTAAGVTQIQLRPAPNALDPELATRTIELLGSSVIPRFS